jgi:hypothetical protein
MIEFHICGVQPKSFFNGFYMYTFWKPNFLTSPSVIVQHYEVEFDVEDGVVES